MAETRTPITITSDLDIEEGAVLDGVPEPPKAIREALTREGQVWRWLATGHVDRRSMRGYLAYSATAADREAAKRDGRFRVDVENKLCWGADAFLGVMSRIQFENRARARRRLTDEQTLRSKTFGAFQEQARRIGSDAQISVQETVSRSLE